MLKLAPYDRELFKSFVAEAFDVEYRAIAAAPCEYRAAMLEVLIVKAARWDTNLHPRSDDGRFVSRDAIAAAKGDPAKEEALRDKVTDPEQREKLDNALAGTTDLGRTKAGQRKHEAGQRREKRAASHARAAELADKIAAGEATPEDMHELGDHLEGLTVDKLRALQSRIPTAGRTRRKAEMVAALRDSLEKSAHLKRVTDGAAGVAGRGGADPARLALAGLLPNRYDVTTADGEVVKAGTGYQRFEGQGKAVGYTAAQAAKVAAGVTPDHADRRIQEHERAASAPDLDDVQREYHATIADQLRGHKETVFGGEKPAAALESLTPAATQPANFASSPAPVAGLTDDELRAEQAALPRRTRTLAQGERDREIARELARRNPLPAGGGTPVMMGGGKGPGHNGEDSAGAAMLGLPKPADPATAHAATLPEGSPARAAIEAAVANGGGDRRRTLKELGHRHAEMAAQMSPEEEAGYVEMMAKHGVKPLHEPGQTVPFDPETMQSDAGISTGTPVKVTRRGWTGLYGDANVGHENIGNNVQRAQVEPAGGTNEQALAKQFDARLRDELQAAGHGNVQIVHDPKGSKLAPGSPPAAVALRDRLLNDYAKAYHEAGGPRATPEQLAAKLATVGKDRPAPASVAAPANDLDGLLTETEPAKRLAQAGAVLGRAKYQGGLTPSQEAALRAEHGRLYDTVHSQPSAPPSSATAKTTAAGAVAADRPELADWLDAEWSNIPKQQRKNLDPDKWNAEKAAEYNAALAPAASATVGTPPEPKPVAATPKAAKPAPPAKPVAATPAPKSPAAMPLHANGLPDVKAGASAKPDDPAYQAAGRALLADDGFRKDLADAYNHQRLFVEHRDGLIPLDRVYHELAKRRPGVTVDQLHAAVDHLSRERGVEMHALNEIAKVPADERIATISRNDRNYHFMRFPGGADAEKMKPAKAAKPPAPAKPTPARQPKVAPASGYGQSGADHPLGQTDADHYRSLGDAIAAHGGYGGKFPAGGTEDDPLGHGAAGFPAGVDRAAFVTDVRGVVGRSQVARAVGASFPELYATVGKKYGMSKHDFARAMHDVDESREPGLRASGWSRMLTDMPEPGLATMNRGKVMHYIQPTGAGTADLEAMAGEGDTSLNVDHPEVRKRFGGGAPSPEPTAAPAAAADPTAELAKLERIPFGKHTKEQRKRLAELRAAPAP